MIVAPTDNPQDEADRKGDSLDTTMTAEIVLRSEDSVSREARVRRD
jgi:hypothetical protein